jgi:threonine dehydrogenase-like Zn-dependent dehydrogenase
MVVPKFVQSRLLSAVIIGAGLIGVAAIEIAPWLSESAGSSRPHHI